MKLCKKCNKNKLLADFSKSSITKDSLQTKCKDCDRAYYLNNKKHKIAYQNTWALSNPAKISLHQKTWALNNRHRKVSWQSKRRCSQLQRTPSWLTSEQNREIEQVYKEAKELQWLSNEPLEVDHIVPLQGKNVSGLHVPWNLQILPVSLNCIKGNRY